jgi:hypothetical protein
VTPDSSDPESGTRRGNLRKPAHPSPPRAKLRRGWSGYNISLRNLGVALGTSLRHSPVVHMRPRIPRRINVVIPVTAVAVRRLVVSRGNRASVHALQIQFHRVGHRNSVPRQKSRIAVTLRASLRQLPGRNRRVCLVCAFSHRARFRGRTRTLGHPHRHSWLPVRVCFPEILSLPGVAFGALPGHQYFRCAQFVHASVTIGAGQLSQNRVRTGPIRLHFIRMWRTALLSLCPDGEDP